MPSVLLCTEQPAAPTETQRISEVNMQKIPPKAMWISIFLIRGETITFGASRLMREKNSVGQA